MFAHVHISHIEVISAAGHVVTDVWIYMSVEQLTYHLITLFCNITRTQVTYRDTTGLDLAE